MANRITTVFDAQTKSFSQGVQSIKRDVKDAEGAVGKFKAGWAGAMAEFKNNRGAQAAVAGIVTGLGVKAVQAASSLEESVNAVIVTCGAAAEGVLKVGENAAESFGLSKREFNELAVQFSAFAEQVAGPGGDVTAVIEDMVTRVADFASVMNMDVAEAGQIFQSTLAGQTEPIRKYGKDVSAAAVTQYALSEGMIETASEMTEAIKVQARYGLLMRETADLAGDFQATSDGLANSTRIATSKFEDMQAAIGSKLIPVVEDAMGAMLGFADGIEYANEKTDGWLSKLTGADKGLLGVTKGLWDKSVGQWIEWAKGVDESVGNMIGSTDAGIRQQKEYVDSLVKAGDAQVRAAEATSAHSSALDEQSE